MKTILLVISEVVLRTRMADPTVQSFCCRRPLRPDKSLLLAATENLLYECSTKPYLLISLVSATIGIAGALYQIFVRYAFNRDNGEFRLYYLRTMRYFAVPNRILAQHVSKRLIVWLAVADLLACTGLFIRSIFVWIYVRPIIFGLPSAMPEDSRILFCAVTSALIQFFYTCTWLFTLCYAISIRAYLKGQVISEKKYHAFVWPIAAVLTGLGTTVLYFPNAE